MVWEVTAEGDRQSRERPTLVMAGHLVTDRFVGSTFAREHRVQ